MCLVLVSSVLVCWCWVWLILVVVNSLVMLVLSRVGVLGMVWIIVGLFFS